MSIRHGGKIVAGSINKDQIEEYIDSEIESKSYASVNIINGLTSNNTNELPLDGIKLDYPNQILSVNIGNTIILPSLYTLSEDGLKVILENEIESNIHYSISYIKRYEIVSIQPDLSEFDNMFSSKILTLLETIYPIGSLYFGTQTTCPMMTIIPNSTWELVTSNKALWTGDGSNANTTIDAGLPNITGGFEYHVWAQNKTGSFYNGSSGIKRGGNDVDNGSNDAQTLFDASRSNPIYGNSDTVQPPAYVINVWRRTK